MDAILQSLRQKAGIHFMGVDARLQTPEMALDAQSPLVTTSNAGIFALLSTYIDPAMIRVLVAPMRAAEIAGREVQKGDWLTDTAAFPVIESTGETSSYGDYNNNGVSGANFDFPQRQSYHYQVITQYGEREIERAGLNKVDYVNEINMASILTLNKFQNKSYFFGIAGLQLYGLLNDPQLPAAIPPTTETGGFITWVQKDALGVLADVAALFTQLQLQSNGNVELDTPMTLSMSPVSEAVGLTKTNNFNVNVFDLIKKNYPNMMVKTAPEYATAAGQLVQLKADELEGQRTVDCAFTEKLRAHPIVIDSSSFRQKKSQGTFGAIYYRPFLVTQMIGV
jgi:hypothetical protein